LNSRRHLSGISFYENLHQNITFYPEYYLSCP
jgi:hypothetical protein